MSERLILGADHPVLRDHTVLGKRVFPGLGYVDLFYQILRERGQDFACVQLRNCSIYRPLIVEDGAQFELRLDTVEIGAAAVRLEIWGRPAEATVDAAWTRYASTEFRMSTSQGFEERIDVESIQRSGRLIASMSEIYASCRAQNLVHGEFMRADGACLETDTAIYASCSVSGEQVDAEGLMFHPGLLDGAAVGVATALGLRQAGGSQRLTLPLCFESFRASKLVTESCFVRAKRESIRRVNELGYLSLDFFDMAGEKVAELIALAGKPVPAGSLLGDPRLEFPKVSEVQSPIPSGPSPASSNGIPRSGLLRLITELVAKRRGVPVDRIGQTTAFAELGLDSGSLLELVPLLEGRLGIALSPTLLFEHGTCAELAAHLAQQPVGAIVEQSPSHTLAEARRSDPAPVAREGDVVAIIGMTGRFPGAPDIQTLWSNLLAGIDSVTEVPSERWSVEVAVTGPAEGRAPCRWGGFIDGVADFDPLFFRISPRHATAMDPQERLFLESAWDLLESAAYTREELRCRYGSKVGVYVGSMYHHRGGPDGDPVTTSLAAISSQSAIANRVSSFFGLEGPSVAVDTMCSSAATAIHLARKDLLAGECDLAIAGAVNLSVDEHKYLGLSRIELTATHPGSRSFADGDGFLPAECVGSVLLKRLSDAERDGDQILAIIKASAISHGGRGSGFAAPNIEAQARLIEATLRSANVDASSVGVVEAAANGAMVGDAIEVAALKRVFGGEKCEVAFCSLGAVKSNIGHPEAASAIAQLVKVVLQMRHGQLVPTIFSEPRNKAIVLENSAFAMQTEAQVWKRRIQTDDGVAVALPRRALINSFGAGGSYACLLIEEHIGTGAPADGPSDRRDEEQLILLSARTDESLRKAAERLCDSLKTHRNYQLADIAYTLQIGRESMEHRLAFIVCSVAELIEGLERFVANSEGTGRQYTGQVTDDAPLANLLTPEIGSAIVDAALAGGDPGKLAQLWALGGVVPWAELHAGRGRRKLQLPTYPYEKLHFSRPTSAGVGVMISPAIGQVAERPVTVQAATPSMPEDVAPFVTQWLSETLALPQEQLRPDRFLQAFGFDSVVAMRFAAALDSRFGVRPPATVLLVDSTITSVVRYVTQRRDPTKSPQAVSAGTNEAPASDICPLSEAQGGIWSYCKGHPASAAYNIPVCIRFRATLDLSALEQALTALLAQHPMLTAVVEESQGVPRLRFRPDARARIERRAVCGLSHDELITELAHCAQEPLSINTGPLLRVYLFEVSPKESVLLAVLHHLVFDGASVEPLLESLIGSYEAVLAGEAPSLVRVGAHYTTFSTWEQDYLGSAQALRDRAHWLEHLEGFESGQKPAVAVDETQERASLTRVLAAETATTLRTMVKERGVNLPAAFLCAYEAMLRQYRGCADLVVGVPVVVRPQERFHRMVGHCVNLLPLRSTVTTAVEPETLLGSTQARMATALEHASYPFRRMVRDRRSSGTASDVPMVRDVFVHRSASTLNLGAWQAREGAAVRIELFDGVHQESEYPLLLEVIEAHGEFALRLVAGRGELRGLTIEEMMDTLCAILAQIAGVSQPDHAAGSDGLEKLLHGGVEAQGARTPDDPALLFRDRTLTYATLIREADALAAQLADYGIGRGAIVGVLADRSMEMVIALLGILKAGAAYLPLDPRLPDDRLQFLLIDAQVSTVITHGPWEAKARKLGGVRIHVCGEGNAGAPRYLGARVTAKPRGEDLAYVIYTSGSTGRPKGCMISHAAVYNRLRWIEKWIPISASDRILQKTPFSFDVSVPEFFWPLAHGATLVIAEPEGHKDSTYLIDTIRRHRITVCHFVPSMLRLFLRSDGISRCDSLRHVLASGEALSAELIAAFKRKSSARLHNLYGPTEAAVEVTHWECEERDDGKVPIGRAIDNVRLLLLDDALNEVPPGETAELYIAGICLANGYLNRPALTAERFIADPFVPGERLYRTGDLARREPDGCIEYLGRADSQIKINGFRVELGEIEQRLQEHTDVAAAAAVVATNDDHKQISVYYTVKHEADARTGADERRRTLRDFLRMHLPAYMVPVHFHEISAMPLTSSGKVDRKALPAAVDVAPAQVAPRIIPHASDIEATVLSVWRDVLRGPAGLDDAFFDVGGDSVLAVTVCERVAAHFGIEFTPTTFFRAGTVRAMSRYVADALSPNHSAVPASVTPVVTMPAPNREAEVDGSELPLPPYYGESVAIIGMSCEFPGASDHREFWQNIRAGVESVEVLDAAQLDLLGVPAEVAAAPGYVPVRCTIPGKTLFDAEFFGVAPAEARSMDPQLRVLLTHCWKSIEDAGYAHTDIADTAVFMSASSALRTSVSDSNDHLEPYVNWVKSQPGTVPTQISHRLKLTGPSLFVHSNCSSSLVGLGLAFRCLLAREASYALVGATTLFSGQSAGYLHAEGMNLSRRGHVRAFDAGADGMLAGEGVAVVLLKPAADAVRDGNHIYALIRGVATRNDGGDKAGFYAPAVRGQADAIERALQAAKVDPESIGYVEAHGTGTRLGDPVEFAALTEAYRRHTSEVGYCGLGSVKSNIGHLDTAAGLAGCIKVALSLAHGEMPPSVNCDRPNPDLHLEKSPFFIVEQPRSWRRGVSPRRGAVSSMGLGGTNAHAILEENTAALVRGARDTAEETQIVPLSARTDSTLREYARSLASFLAAARAGGQRVSLRDLAFTMRVGRVAMASRAAFIASSLEELEAQLAAFAEAEALLPGCQYSSGQEGVRQALADEDVAVLIDRFVAAGSLDRIARYWVNGGASPWERVHRGAGRFKRLSLPTYPFALDDWGDGAIAEGAAGAEPRALAAGSSTGPLFAAPLNSRSRPAGVVTEVPDDHALDFLRTVLSRALGVPASRVESSTRIEALGLDSVEIARMANTLRASFPGITTNVFFEHQTVGALAAYLDKTRPDAALATSRHRGSDDGAAAPSSSQASGDIAIIGLSGRYPKAANVNELWERLCTGENCIDRIPADRWNADQYYDERRGVWGSIYTKWGGFLDHIDKFDADFFRISPREAETIDPQERLFLQEAYATVEDAGYTPGGLSQCGKVGVFVGVTNRMYPKLAGYVNPCGLWSVANRVSFLLNFTGPSLAVDTACSASLTAIHLAVESLRSGASACAIAGGVNLIVDPIQYMAGCAIGALSAGDRCRPFGDLADGFVEGEAVGAILLKPLEAAQADGDHVYAVIKGTAVTHGGRTNGYTVPNPAAQARLISEALSRAHVNARDISYVEAHGTGTALGDPIEVAGLSAAFRTHTHDNQFCALGSIKSNIGHAESAAGIAGVTKVLLQLRSGKIAPTLHAQVHNPQIDFERSPFRLQNELGEWKSRGAMRVAAVSSFGIGGANAHIILAEHAGAVAAQSRSGQQPVAIILSARNVVALQKRVAALLECIRSRPLRDGDLDGLAYTLQTGRESMQCRLGFIASSISEVEHRLEALQAAQTSHDSRPVEGIWSGEAKPQSAAVDARDQELGLAEVLDRWTQGAEIDWAARYGVPRPRRFSLPTYPFALERHWVTTADTGSEAAPPRTLTANGEPVESTVAAATAVPQTVSAEDEPFELMQFEEDWVPADGVDVPAAGEIKRVVCFVSSPDHRRGIERRVRQLHAGAQVIFVGEGAEYQHSSATEFTISAGNVSHYERALGQILAEHRSVAAVIYLWPLESPRWLGEPAPILYLIQGLMRSQLKCGRVLLAGECRPGVERCHLDSWVGFERSMGLILPQTPVAVIYEEVGEPVSGNRSLLDAVGIESWTQRLCEELSRSQSQSAFYSRGVRHISRIRPVDRAPGAPGAPLRRGGTYLITGGTGGLGLVVARFLASQYSANLVLTGRSEIDGRRRSAISELERAGASSVTYAKADVCDLQAMRAAVEQARTRYGSIQGVVHAAGLESGEGIATKTLDQFERICAPKVQGTLVLDEALRGEPLDFICYFSSSSGVLGDFGACDYSIANRFEAAYARYRGAREDASGLNGKAIAISWPMWKDGGMGVVDEHDARTHMYFKSSGQRLLLAGEGVQTFAQRLGEESGHTLVVVGRPRRVHRFLGLTKTNALPADAARETQGNGHTSLENPGRSSRLRGLEIAQCVAWDIKEHAARLLKLPRERIDMQTNLADFGFDSIGLTEFARALSDHYGMPVAPAVFFAHPTLGQVVAHFDADRRAEMARFYGDECAATSPISAGAAAAENDASQEKVDVPQNAKKSTVAWSGSCEPIAVIGMSGRFPQCRTVEELWKVLVEARDAVDEISAERFDWRDHYGGPKSVPGKSNTKWCGSVPGAMEFEPAFFEISPREAAQIDPRQRLVLQEAWRALEDAGVGPAQLRTQRVGMFVGVEQGDYQILAGGEASVTANHEGILAARLAYFLNLNGPVMAINTACSSGLVAAHQACLSLRSGECDAAVAAGVNLLLTPYGFVGMSQAGMFSEDGKCRAFAENANGMVPAEAVAVVVLKRLSQAQADGDPIYAVIRGSGINYDGRTNGITAPNGVAQARLIRDVYTRHNVSPREIGYVVTHGTGTPLGDPVEVSALNEVFSETTPDLHFCALTSTKSNLGHTFAASGLVSLIALIQAMRNRTIPATLHCEQLSRHIDWNNSPFYVNRVRSDWSPAPSGKLVGALSAFGMSGTNAHMVIESYEAHATGAGPAIPSPVLLVLSGKTEQGLQERVHDLQEALLAREWSTGALRAASFTLLCGRHHFAHRWAVVVHDRGQAIELLRQFSQEDTLPNIFRGKVTRGFVGQVATIRYGQALLEEIASSKAGLQDNLRALADLYCQGYELPWERLFGDAPPERARLPGYPFSRHTYGSTAGTERRPLSPEASAPAPTEVASAEASTRAAGKIVLQATDALDREPPEPTLPPTAKPTKIQLEPVGPGSSHTDMYDAEPGPTSAIPRVFGTKRAPGAASTKACQKPGTSAASPPASRAAPRVVRKEDLIELLAQTLYLPPEEVDDSQPFNELGLDSITAVEWIRAVNQKYAVSIPVTCVYTYPDVRSFYEFLCETVDVEPSAEGLTAEHGPVGAAPSRSYSMDKLLKDLYEGAVSAQRAKELLNQLAERSTAN